MQQNRSDPWLKQLSPWILLGLGLSVAVLLWARDSWGEDAPSQGFYAAPGAESSLESFEPAYVANIATDVFAGERGAFVRLRNIAVDGAGPTYTTDYQVLVTESLKGRFESGDVVTVRQFGGSDGTESSYVPGDEPMLEGQEYLFITRPTSDGLAFGLFEPEVCKVTLTSDVREQELSRWRTAISAGPPTTATVSESSPEATSGDEEVTIDPTSTATTTLPAATATPEPTGTIVSGPIAEPSATSQASPITEGSSG